MFTRMNMYHLESVSLIASGKFASLRSMNEIFSSMPYNFSGGECSHYNMLEIK